MQDKQLLLHNLTRHFIKKVLELLSCSKEVKSMKINFVNCLAFNQQKKVNLKTSNNKTNKSLNIPNTKNTTNEIKEIHFGKSSNWITIGYEVSPQGAYIRDLIRAELEMKATLRDNELQTKKPTAVILPQLPEESKYYQLGVPVTYKDGKKMYICANLKDTPDLNGLRGKTPLSGKKQALNWRIQALKKAGIKTVIDLRSTGECSKAALDALQSNNLNYINFPVEDMSWQAKSLNDITQFIEAINQGDFYVGCANGEARTDLAIAINYLFNPKAKNYPTFYFAKANTRGVTLKNNIRQIMDLIEENTQTVINWGYKDENCFKQQFSQKLKTLFENLKNSK